MVTSVVADASVAIKWLLPLQPDEADVEQALRLIEWQDRGEVELHQPPHFIAEVAAVVARVSPDDAEGILLDLLNLDIRRVEATLIYATATALSVRLQHHLFDTLYHATALHIPGATYVTADLRYYEKAKAVDQIALLADFDLPQ